MSRRKSLAQRSAIEWSVRGAMAIVAAAVAVASLSSSLAFIIKRRDPAWAHSMSPGDGRITALLAERTLLAGVAPAQRRRSNGLARQALIQDATAVPAVVAAGLNTQLRGDLPLARKVFAYSRVLSRRNIQTRYWAIEDAVARNDIPEALRHYDIALRTNRTAPDTLFPVLASASADPAVAAQLVKTLAARPSWGMNFIDYVSGSGPDARAVGRLFQRLGTNHTPVSQAAQAVVITRLITHGAIEDAWSYYASMHAGVDRRASRDPRFERYAPDPTPFDWVPVNEAGITTSIQRGRSGGVFDFAAPSGVGGAVLRQTQMLPRGDYVLRGHSIGIDLPPEARPYWLLSCGDGREAGRVPVSNSAEARGFSQGRFAVPEKCPIQTLVLTTRPADSVSGVTGQIDYLQLRSVSLTGDGE